MMLPPMSPLGFPTSQFSGSPLQSPLVNAPLPSPTNSDSAETAEGPEIQITLPETFETREEGVRWCFDFVDKDRSGFLDRSEFRTIATKVNPQRNLSEAVTMLDNMDTDSDGLVSWEEFKLAFQQMTSTMTDEEFMHNIRKNVLLEESVQDGYTHPVKNRRYLQRSCINAVLSEGLEELIREVQLNRCKLASGSLWDEKGFLPRGYKPLNPLQFLGEYIMGKLKKNNELKEAFAEQERKRMELAEMEIHKPYSQLTQLGKLKLLWNSLVPEDADDTINSKLPVAEMVTVGKDLGYPLAVVDEMLERLGYHIDYEDTLEPLEFFEFEQIFQKYTEDFMPEEVDAFILLRLGASHLPFLNNKEKAQLIFAKLDEDHSGELEVQEIVLLGKMLQPMAAEEEIKRAVAYLDADNSQSVDHEEFVTAMTAILNASETENVDAAITKIMEIGVDAMDLATQYMSKPFKAYVIGHATHKMADQLGVKTVFECLEEGDKIVFVDVRGPEEVAVSRIRGAILVTASPASKSKGGWTIKSSLDLLTQEDLAKLRGEDGEEKTLVVVYCTGGQRASSVASMLSKKLDGKPVYNLCGGVIEWYNKGGVVVDPDDEPVDSIHPYQRDLIEFIERPSEYSMPAAKAKKTALKSPKKGVKQKK